MTQSSTTGIDELLEIWLLSADDPGKYDEVELSTPGYGSGRVFSAMNKIVSVGGTDTSFDFSNNTWYRMVLSGGPTSPVRASIFADDGTTELIGVNLGNTLGDLGSSFRIGLSQSMGLPGAPYPTDSAVDYLRLSTPSTVPEPPSFALLALGCTAIGLLRWLWPVRSSP
jgi:hypothetical protein